MNDKTAREAAWIQYKERRCSDNRLTCDYEEIAFEAGWNARQPKPCVWTRSSVYPGFRNTACGNTTRILPTPGNLTAPVCCPCCGGKIEESE